MTPTKRIQHDDPLSACPLKPAQIVAIWNSLAEDHGRLSAVLIEFARRLLEAAKNPICEMENHHD